MFCSICLVKSSPSEALWNCSHLRGNEPSIIHSIPIEDVIRESVREFDPPRTLSELAVLVCDAVGEPTRKCYGVHLRGPREIVDCVVARQPISDGIR